MWMRVAVTCLIVRVISCFEHETRLFSDLFHDYNKWIRPCHHLSDVTDVSIHIAFEQLIDIDEKNFIMVSSVVLHQQWYDVNLLWNSSEYGGITSILVPASTIWQPDIVLRDSMDGIFVLNPNVLARVRSDGLVSWSPQAKYSSLCIINVIYFPFDEQTCNLRFSSWTYNVNQVHLTGNDPLVNSDRLRQNGEWHMVRGITAENHAHLDSMPHAEISTTSILTYTVILHRVPVFYCVFILIPCIGISFLTVLVFVLPADTHEKMILSISVLLAHEFYLLVTIEIVPSNGLSLLGEYLLFNMIFMCLTILSSVVVINVHHRMSVSARRLPKKVWHLMIHTLPKILRLTPPEFLIKRDTRGSLSLMSSARIKVFISDFTKNSNLPEELCCEVASAIESAFYIMVSLKQKIRIKQAYEEWRFVALVVDRIFLVAFLVTMVYGSIVIIISWWIENSIAYSRLHSAP